MHITQVMTELFQNWKWQVGNLAAVNTYTRCKKADVEIFIRRLLTHPTTSFLLFGTNYANVFNVNQDHINPV